MLQALVGAVGRRQGCEAIRSATTILPIHWASPEELPAEDPCRAATDPAAWLGECCHTTGIWPVGPGLPVPAEGWVVTLLHALKARLTSTLLSQRAVPLHRALRGHISPKMTHAAGLAAPLSEGTCYLPALPLARALGVVA